MKHCLQRLYNRKNHSVFMSINTYIQDSMKSILDNSIVLEGGLK